MKRRIVEVVCDGCGIANHVAPGTSDSDLRAIGYIVTRGHLHFCSLDCLRDFNAAEAEEGDS